MNKLKKWIFGFRPKAVPSCVAAVLFSAASLLTAAAEYGGRVPGAVETVIYACAAVSLAFSLWAIILAVRDLPLKERLHSAAQKTRFTSKLMADYSFRTVAVTYATLAMDLLLALMKAAAGWYFASAWLTALAGYYATMTAALQGIVVLVVREGQGFIYNGMLIYAVALYDFYCLTRAVVYMVGTRKRHSPVLVSIKSFSFAAALVAMLSLQTAMFASFGRSLEPSFQRLMNAFTGSAICLILLTVGISMVIGANKRLSRT